MVLCNVHSIQDLCNINTGPDRVSVAEYGGHPVYVYQASAISIGLILGWCVWGCAITQWLMDVDYHWQKASCTHGTVVLGLAPQDPPVGVGRVPAEVAAQRRTLPRLRAMPKLQKGSVRLTIQLACSFGSFATLVMVIQGVRDNFHSNYILLFCLQ